MPKIISKSPNNPKSDKSREKIRSRMDDDKSFYDESNGHGHSKNEQNVFGPGYSIVPQYKMRGCLTLDLKRNGVSPYGPIFLGVVTGTNIGIWPVEMVFTDVV